jgi:DNA-binding NtrC family response regulator
MANILVVDDEVGIRELLSEILSDEGHVVTTADSAHSARRLRIESEPDLILLDIWMPDLDGISLLREWVQAGPLVAPVIMMSGHATLETAGEATRLGALDFLEKPVALARLLAAVRQGLDHGQRSRSNPAGPVPALPPSAAGGARPGPASETGSDIDAPASLVSASAANVNLDQPLRDARDQFERVYFEYQLAKENYSMTRVADRAGLERTHLYRKLKQLGVELGRHSRKQEGTDAFAAPVLRSVAGTGSNR